MATQRIPPARRERIAKAVDLRRNGASYRTIGRQLEITGEQALLDVRDGLHEVTAETAADMVALELARLDDLYLMAMQAARKTPADAKAIEMLLKITDRRSRLLPPVPRASGSVVGATRAALEAASLSESSGPDAGAVTVLLKLAAVVDEMDANGLNPAGKLDNVSIPTYLKYSESLGLTPAARAAASGAPIEAEMGGGVRGGKLASVVTLAAQATG